MPKLRALLLFSILTLAFVGCKGIERSGLGPGDNPPNISAETLTGGKLTLKEYEGKFVLIDFWATWCGPCIAEMPALERLYTSLKDRGFVVLGIAIDDDKETILEFLQQSPVSFPIALDTTGAIKRAYQISGVPESILVDRTGKLVLFPDPENGMPTVRIKGPRSWDSPSTISLLTNLMDSATKQQ